MSFILDALKKSENERQRHRGPSLVDVPARRAPNERPWWVIGIAALLVLNLVVFVFVLLRKDDPPSVAAPAAVQEAPAVAAPAPVPMPAAAPAPSSTTRPSYSGDPTVRSLAEEAGVAESMDIPPPADADLMVAADVPAGPPIVSPIRGPNSVPVRTPPAPPSSPPSSSDEHLPTINDLTASSSAQLPPMHLDIHVYATSPADRFVFINMKKYREGETTSEGLAVEHIRRDGVVLNQRGMRFVLPRQ